MSHFKLCAVDLEATTYNELTGENKDQIDLIGLMYGDTYVHFKTVKEFWDYIDEHIIELNKYYCLAHNGGGYDFLFLVRIPDKYKENIQFDVMINGRFTEITYKKKIKRKTYYIKFRDSYKVISSSLSKLGKAFGYPKTEMPSWRENQKKGLSFEEHYNQSIIYNRNDCEILIKIMDKFLNDDTFKYLKTMPLTISSLALKTFKHMRGIKRLCELSNASYHDDYLRKAYSGGRTEVFKMQVDEDYSYLDVNSLYPSQMLKPLPVGKVHKFTSWFNVNEAYKNRMAGVYEVEWKAPEMHTPILWERKDFQHASKLIFGLNRKTNKEGKGFYALPELLLAEEHGYSIKPISCVVADETEPIFKEYVETFIQMKYKGGAKKEIAKLLLNSLYGKTGQRLMTQTSGTLSPETAFKKQELYVANIASLNNAIEANASPHIIDELSNRVKNSRFYCIDKDLELYNYTAKKDHRDTNVMWASYITAFARCVLWKACERCDFEQAYVDTDSCIMPMEYKKKMPIHEKELGMWKEEGVVHHGKFYAPKSYIMDITCEDLRQTKVVMKGVDREILRKYFKYDPQLDKSYIPYTDYNILTNTFKPNASFNTIKITPFKQAKRMKLESGVARDITKILNLNYDKRLVLDNGNTLPF